MALKPIPTLKLSRLTVSANVIILKNVSTFVTDSSLKYENRSSIASSKKTIPTIKVDFIFIILKIYSPKKSPKSGMKK